MAAVDDLAGGGAPLLGEPLPVELANTRYAVRGAERDGLASAGALAAWLRDTRGRLLTTLADEDLLAVGDADVATARDLRDAVHALLGAVVEGTPAPAGAVATVNEVARSVSRWPQLRWGEAPALESAADGRAVAAALAELAGATVDLLTGPHRDLLRACRAPGCVLFFVKSHPRRTWCSEGCGNRARVARFHARRLAEGDPG